MALEDYRSLSTRDIYWHLEKNQSYFSLEDLIVLCDELLKREEKIKYLKDRYERLVQRLGNKSLRKIEENDEQYSPATLKVVAVEMKKRHLNRVQWFYSKDDGDTQGPVNREDIVNMILNRQLVERHMIWKEGSKEWRRVGEMPHLAKDLYFDQVETEELSRPESHQQKSQDTYNPVQEETSQSGETNSYHIPAGIMELASIPFWLMGIVYSFFLGLDSRMGFMIPVLFALFASASTIPVGIGLFLKKKWAWSIKVFTACGAIILIVLQISFDEISGLWTIFAAYQAVILLLLFSGKNNYS